MGGRNSHKDRETLFDYTSDSITLEYENRLLKETVNQLREELDRFKTPPLMVCDIYDIQGNKAIIRIPNGNKFLVNVSNTCKELKAGHTVLVDQKNLNVIEKIDQNKNFKPWLFQIAKNASIDFLRKKKTVSFSRFENEKGQNVFIENIVAKPANLIGKLSDKKVLSTAMQGLDQKEQKIIKMRHDDGLSFKEIADILKKPLNTIKSRHRRILLRLRRNIIEKNGREPKA